MTSKKSLATIRGTDEDKRLLDQLVKQSGLSQQDYLLKVALSGLPLDDGSTYQTPDSSLLSTLASQQKVIASQQETIEQLSEQLSMYQADIAKNTYSKEILEASDIKYQRGVCVSGLEADRVLLVAKQDKPSPHAPKGKPKLALAYDLLWLVVKTQNGNQRRIEAIAEVPKELQDCRSDYDSLSKLHKALDGYQRLIQLDGWELLSLREQQRAVSSCYFAEGCKKTIASLIEDTAEAIAALKATHTPVNEVDIRRVVEEPENVPDGQIEADINLDAIDSNRIAVSSEPDSSLPVATTEATETATEPTLSSTLPTPQPSAEVLARDSFRDRFGLDTDAKYSLVMAQGRKPEGWEDENHTRWWVSGKGTKAKWSQIDPRTIG